MLQPITPGICKAKINGLNQSCTPSSNTGYSKPDIRVRHDWISLSFRQERLPQNLAMFGVKLFLHLARQGVLTGEGGGWTVDPDARGFNGFEHGCNIKFRNEIRASLQWGGQFQRGWVLLEIRGAMCALLDRKQLIFLYRAACKYEARIGHVDLAADDLEGLVFCPHKVRKALEEQPYTLIPSHQAERGHRPAFEWVESDTGCTCYVGSRQSLIRLRVYQKGRQLHDTLEGRRHPAWVRWESIFRRQRGHEIDHAILHPDYIVKYLLGSSKYLATLWVDNGLKATWKPDTYIKEPREIAAKALLIFKNQWGGVLWHLRRLIGSEAFFDAVQRENGGPLADLNNRDVPYIFEMLAELQQATDAGYAAAAPASDITDTVDW